MSGLPCWSSYLLLYKKLPGTEQFETKNTEGYNFPRCRTGPRKYTVFVNYSGNNYVYAECVCCLLYKHRVKKIPLFLQREDGHLFSFSRGVITFTRRSHKL